MQTLLALNQRHTATNDDAMHNDIERGGLQLLYSHFNLVVHIAMQQCLLRTQEYPLCTIAKVLLQTACQCSCSYSCSWNKITKTGYQAVHLILLILFTMFKE